MNSRDRRVLRFGYVVIVLAATFSGLSPEWTLAPVPERLARALIPDLHGGDVLDAIRNAALFVGMGAVWVVTDARRAWRSSIIEAVLASLIFSAGIEVIQLLSPVRTASILDVITDTFGGFAGAVGLALLVEATRRTRSARSFLGVPAWLVAGSYAGAVLAEAIGPLFRQEIIGATGVDPLGRLSFAMSNASFGLDHWYTALDLVLDAILFLPLGALWVLAIREHGKSAAQYVWLIASISALAFAGAEAIHGIFGVKIVLLAIPAHIAGVVAGFMGMRLYRGSWPGRDNQDVMRTLLYAYAGMLLLWGLRPFVPTFDYEGIKAQFSYEQLIPMQALAVRKDIYSVTHVFRQTLLFFPVGVVLARWPLFHHRWMSNLLPVFYLASAIEVSHLIIDGRFFDTTNILLALAGAGLGWLVVRSAAVDDGWRGAVPHRGRPPQTRVRARRLAD